MQNVLLEKQKVDFDIFAPMNRISLICILFTLTYFKVFVHQINVKTIFLNGILEEKFFMEQSESYKVLGKKIKFVN